MVLDQDIKEYTTFDNALKVRVVFIITNCFFQKLIKHKTVLCTKV